MPFNPYELFFNAHFHGSALIMSPKKWISKRRNYELFQGQLNGQKPGVFSEAETHSQ